MNKYDQNRIFHKIKNVFLKKKIYLLCILISIFNVCSCTRMNRMEEGDLARLDTRGLAGFPGGKKMELFAFTHTNLLSKLFKVTAQV